jgi:hypothetical protein
VTGTEELSLSIVLAANNTAAETVPRLLATVSAWCVATRRASTKVEFVIVDWNTSSSRQPLRHALRNEAFDIPVRILSISEALHDSFPQAAQISLIEHLAWNAGIRRSRGRYVMVTRPGVIPTDELTKFVLSEKLEAGCLYRTDVYETPNATGSAQEMALKAKRVHRSRETLDLENLNVDYRFRRGFDIWGEPLPLMIWQIFVHFLLLTHDEVFSWRKGMARPYRPLSYLGKVWLSDVRNAWCLFKTRRAAEMFFRPVHVNAAGDFLLASREDWLACRGLPEYRGHTYLTDALFVMAAIASGRMREKVLAWPSAVVRDSRLETEPPSMSSLPTLTPFEAAKEADIIVKTRAEVGFNEEEWGLGELELMEWTLGAKRSAA